MSVRDALLPLIASIRRIPGDFGLREKGVTVRVITWSGDRIGKGAKTVTDTDILTGGYTPKIRQVSAKEVVASGGQFGDRVLEIGPIQPDFPGGGVKPSWLNPPPVGGEVFWIINAPGFSDAGDVYELLSVDTLPSFHFTVRVKKAGKGA